MVMVDTRSNTGGVMKVLLIMTTTSRRWCFILRHIKLSDPRICRTRIALIPHISFKNRAFRKPIQEKSHHWVIWKSSLRVSYNSVVEVFRFKVNSIKRDFIYSFPVFSNISYLMTTMNPVPKVVGINIPRVSWMARKGLKSYRSALKRSQ